MNPFAKFLIITGSFLIVTGILWQLGWLQALKLGRLPGDVMLERENMKFYFPITTGILISVVLTVLSWIFRRL